MHAMMVSVIIYDPIQDLNVVSESACVGVKWSILLPIVLAQSKLFVLMLISWTENEEKRLEVRVWGISKILD